MRTIEELHRATEKNDIPASIDTHPRFHRLSYDLSRRSILQSLWNGWKIKLRLYLTIALQGDIDGFRQELARHFESALRA